MKINTDHIGIVLSCTCLVHCLALPFILLGMGIYVDNELIHGLLLLTAILTTSHAVYHSFKKHCKHIVIFFALIGIAFLSLDLLVGHEGDVKIDVYAIIGSVLLVATHVLNVFYNKTSTKECGGCNV